jgi:signal transduction histidine kinase
MDQSQVDYEALYREVLSDFCKTHSEEALYRASLLSATLIERSLGPDEIVALHYEGMQAIALDESLPHSDRIRILNDAHQFLLEVMIAYGAQYKEFLDLRLAEAVRRAENAELGEREKLEVLAMIAHELGNPLTVALGNMQLAIRFLDTQDITSVREAVSESREALERLANLTSQLLAASRGDELTLSEQTVDLRRVLTRAQALANRLADSKHVQVQVQPSSDAALVTGDEEALNSVLNNLVSNAVRYTRAGGTVTLFVQSHGDKIVVGVSDTGIGMSEEAVSRIFEKFFRAEDARTIEPRGIGMGLTIVERLVKAHHGWVEVESEPGVGSTFRVILPAAPRGSDGK